VRGSKWSPHDPAGNVRGSDSEDDLGSEDVDAEDAPFQKAYPCLIGRYLKGVCRKAPDKGRGPAPQTDPGHPHKISHPWGWRDFMGGWERAWGGLVLGVANPGPSQRGGPVYVAKTT
jgi:hypothetical protein